MQIGGQGKTFQWHDELFAAGCGFNLRVRDLATDPGRHRPRQKLVRNSELPLQDQRRAKVSIVLLSGFPVVLSPTTTTTWTQSF